MHTPKKTEFTSLPDVAGIFLCVRNIFWINTLARMETKREHESGSSKVDLRRSPQGPEAHAQETEFTSLPDFADIFLCFRKVLCSISLG